MSLGRVAARCGATARPAGGGGGAGGSEGATKGVSSYLLSWIVPVVYNGTMINVAIIAMCKPVAAAHSRGLLRTFFVVGVSSNAFRKTSFCVVGDKRTGRAGFPVGPAWAGSKRCMGCVVIGPPLLLQLFNHMLDVHT